MSPHITKKMVKDGIILFGACYGAVAAFKAGCREFEKAVPKVVDKIILGRAMASTLVSDEDEYDDFDDDDE